MGSKCYETPPAFFRERWEIHRFTVDAAASDDNALVQSCPIDGLSHACDGEYCHICENRVGRYYTEETNGLDPAHYVEGDRVFCNPPYDTSLIKWVRLARNLSMDGGVLWELLLPASTGTRWFHQYLWNDEAGHWRDGVEGHFIGRVQFLLDGQPIRDARGKVVSSRQENLLVTMKARAL